MHIGLSFAFEKGDATGHYVRGWASVVSVGGDPVYDHEGDYIQIDELRKAAHSFITSARVAKAMHAGSQVGEVVESLIVDDHVAEALGITSPNRGWFIGMQIHDSTIAKRIRDGELRAFSVGGRGQRRPIGGMQ